MIPTCGSSGPAARNIFGLSWRVPRVEQLSASLADQPLRRAPPWKCVPQPRGSSSLQIAIASGEYKRGDLFVPALSLVVRPLRPSRQSYTRCFHWLNPHPIPQTLERHGRLRRLDCGSQTVFPARRIAWHLSDAIRLLDRATFPPLTCACHFALCKGRSVFSYRPGHALAAGVSPSCCISL